MKHWGDYKMIIKLLVKSIVGDLSMQDDLLLKKWCEENESYKILWQEITEKDNWERHASEYQKVDVKTAYVQVFQKYYKNRRKLWIKRGSVAAAVLLIPFLIFYGLQREEKMELDGIVALPPGVVCAELTLADGTVHYLQGNRADSIDNLPHLQMDEKRFSHQSQQGIVQETYYNTLKVPIGGEFRIKLSDGTEIELNSASELRYPEKFIDGERKVYFSGEAYFAVASNPKNPFVVVLEEAEITVLGTHFNVKAYQSEEEIQTTLVEGKVAFQAQGQQLLLNPGEQVVLDRNGSLSKNVVDVDLYTAWRKGIFMFESNTLEEIMITLARWYGFQVVWEDEQQKQVLFTGKLKRYEDFTQLVKMLELTGNTIFEIKNKQVIVKTK